MSALIAGVTPRVLMRGVMLAVLGLMLVHYWWRTKHASRPATDAVAAPPVGREIGR